MREGHDRSAKRRVTPRRTTPRWWRIAAGGVLPVATALLCATTIVLFIAPFPLFPAVVLAELAFVALGTVWIVLATVHGLRYRWDRRILAAPAMVVVTAALVVADVPYRLGWLAAQDAMTEAARSCVETTENHWISVYDVRGVSEHDGGCHFALSGGLINSVGLAYLPEGAPTTGDERHVGYNYEPIGDDWYKYIYVVS